MTHEIPQSVETAFKLLADALATESEALRTIGSEVFHGGSPRQSQGLLRRARDLTKIREDALALHARWQKLESGADDPTAQAQSAQSKAPYSRPVGIRRVPGVSVAETAQALGLTPAKVKELLASGQLKGYQRVSGNWKITRQDLLDYIRAGKRPG
jgi:hypothetical protein